MSIDNIDIVYDRMDSVIKELRKSYVICITHPNPVLN